jgi:acyl carrier protein
MSDLTPRLIAILSRYQGDQTAPIETYMTLSELEIDRRELPMIVCDVEDTFDVHIRYDDVIEDYATVSGLVAYLEMRVTEPRPRPTTPRSKGRWMSTGAERRR